MPELFGEDGKINTEALGDDHKKAIVEYANKNYRDFIPKEFAEDASMASIGDLTTLAKNYKNAQGLIGKKGIIPPTETDGEDRWNEFYTQLGRPKEATEYEYEKVEGFDDPEFLKKFSQVAHKNGLNKKQAKEALKLVQSELTGKQKGAMATYNERLKKEWGTVEEEMGATFNDNKKKVDAVMAKFADDETREWIQKSGIGKEAKMFKFLTKMAESFGEDVVGNMNTNPVNYGPAEAMSRANDIRSNKDNPLNKAYWNREDVRHKEAVAEVEKLFKMSSKSK